MPKSILEILNSKNLLPTEEIQKIQKQAREKNLTVEELLYQKGLSEKEVAEAKSEATGYPIKYIEEAIPSKILLEVPEESARHYKIAPLGKDDGYLEVGMLYPEDVTAREALKFIANKINLPIKIFIIIPSDFQKILLEYQSLSGEVKKALSEFEKEKEEKEPKIKVKPKATAKPLEIIEDAPVTKIVSVILRHAVEGKASDIHIEPMRDQVRVRFRVDGELHTSLTLPPEVQSAISSRIKVMTNMKIDETRAPQDGRFRANILDRDIDFRVSTFPIAFGEKVVIRILDTSGGVKTFKDLGVEGRNLKLIEECIEKPYGLILVTGPTGSGKSTTLYAVLQILNEEASNVVSLEDPVEYYIAGVNQSQIRPEIGYDFASGLRSILRQDPDIIMVGEIRDKETAGLAIHAALTGHLVLATLHTNTSIGVIPRLVDMGVDPYLIAPTLLMAVGQRLGRRLCPDSKKKVELSGPIKEEVLREIENMPPEIRDEVKKNIPSHIYQSQVSSSCPKGTRGRIGVFEMLVMTPELEKIILGGPSENLIMEEAKRQGMVTMRQDGIIKVLNGVMSYEELLEIV